MTVVGTQLLKWKITMSLQAMVAIVGFVIVPRILVRSIWICAIPVIFGALPIPPVQNANAML